LEGIKKSLLNVTALTIIAFILGASYWKGLYFDKDFYWIELTLTLLILFTLMLSGQVRKIFSQPPVILLLLLTLVYGINIFRAENQLLAFEQFYRWVTYLSVFIGVLMIRDKRGMKDILWLSITVGATWIAVFGWLGAYGLVDFKDVMLGNRISSFFQYPNTLGALVAAVLIGILIRATSNKWYSFVSVLSFILFVTLIFSYSRGSWLVFAGIWSLPILILKFKQQLLYITQTILIFIATFFTFNKLSESITNKDYVSGFTTMVVASLAIMVTYAVIHFISDVLSKKVSLSDKARWVIPILVVIGIIAGLIMLGQKDAIIEKLPENLQQRVASINLETSSAVQRTTFNKDAMVMYKDYPVLGAGGGSWRQVYERYQSFPYTSRQSHNYYSQILVETGTIGFILLLGMIGFIIYAVIRAFRNSNNNEKNMSIAIAFIIAVMLGHSLLDFNMSFAYFSTIVFMLFALLYPYEKVSYEWLNRKSITIPFYSIFIITALVSLIMSGRFINAENLNKNLNAKINGQSFDKALELMNKPIKANPYQLDYRVNKINTLMYVYQNNPNDRIKEMVLQEVKSLENDRRRDPSMLFSLAQTYGQLGYLNNAIPLLDEALANGPWQLNTYEQQITYLFSLAEHYKQNGDSDKATELLGKTNPLYDELLAKRKFLDSQELAALKYGSFRPTPTIRQNTGKAFIAQGKYEEGIKILAPFTNEKNLNPESVAWTIYGYEKLNQPQMAEQLRNSVKDKSFEGKLKEIKQTWE